MNDIISSKIENKIFTIRGVQVMIDRDLAELYGVETKVLNQAVKRNLERFPEDFMFELTNIEKNELVTNCDRFNSLKHSTFSPHVFTEQGVASLSGILKSKRAVEINIEIFRAFISLRKIVSSNNFILDKFNDIDKKHLNYETKFDEIFNLIENKEFSLKQGIFYENQTFDAYIFINDLIKKAKNNIILIDNYIDYNTLNLFSEVKNIEIEIFTKKIDNKLKLELSKFKYQHSEINLNIFEFNLSHDRFLILDEKEIYNIGASLKDLGKKWFAFSKLDINCFNLLDKINNK